MLLLEAAVDEPLLQGREARAIGPFVNTGMLLLLLFSAHRASGMSLQQMRLSSIDLVVETRLSLFQHYPRSAAESF